MYKEEEKTKHFFNLRSSRFDSRKLCLLWLDHYSEENETVNQLMFIYSLSSFLSCRPFAVVFGPDWQVNQDETILEGGEIGLSVTLSCIGPSVEEVEVQPCRPRGVMKMTS